MKKNQLSSLNIENLKTKIGIGIKCWLEFHDDERKNILGSGWAKLLETLEKTQEVEKMSLTKAAKECGYSYKYAWSILDRIRKRTGLSPVDSSKGGRGGGGWVKLNEWGKYLLKTYQNLLSELKEIELKLEKSLEID